MMWWREEDAAPTELEGINRDGCYKDAAPDGASGERRFGQAASRLALWQQARLLFIVSPYTRRGHRWVPRETPDCPESVSPD